jgi:serralysin
MWRSSTLGGLAAIVGVCLYLAGPTAARAHEEEATLDAPSAPLTPGLIETDNWPTPEMPPIAACYDPDFPPSQEVMDRLEAYMRDVQTRYQSGTRWSGAVGTPRTLTWSLVPDGISIPGGIGEPTSPSVLFSRMDSLFATHGGRAAWIALIQSCMDRWSALTGVTHVRVQFNGNEWDDGAAFPGSPGAAGLRGDCRISMHNLDGVNGVLAYNQFPSGGDMVLDSSENWASGAPTCRFMRNIVTHEHGHGLGLFHVCPAIGTKLMEPFISTAYDGPQQDDVRGAQHLYGDWYGSNDSFSTATVLSTLTFGTTIRPSTVPVPAINNGSITSIDRAGDQDWYRIPVDAPLLANVTATPVGSTYADYAQDSSCSNNTPNTNALTQAPLGLQIVGANGFIIYTMSATVPAGTAATLNGSLLSPPYDYLKVSATGATTGTQLYNLVITGAVLPSISASDGDFADRVRVTWTDVPGNTGYEVRRNTTTDATGAGPVGNPTANTFDDTTATPGITYYYWVYTIQGGTAYRLVAGPDAGFAQSTCAVDLTGDGIVNVQDFLAFLQAFASGGANADFNGDGQINLQDFLAFLQAYAIGC